MVTRASQGVSRLVSSGISSAPRFVRAFLATETASGLLLVVATVITLAWSNSSFRSSYFSFWSTQLGLHIGDRGVSLDLRGWVTDGLMTIFFLVVGLEIKRELITGELRDRRKVVLPVLAAAGGMLAPALIYVAFNVGGGAPKGWGIPMATDIAFALGVLALLGSRVPSSLRLFLFTLAIADDIGSLIVIVVFYSHGLNWVDLALAACLIVVVAVLRKAGVAWWPVYVFVGASMWLALYQAGVNPTIAGAVMGLMAPVARPRHERPAIQPYRVTDNSAENFVEQLERWLHPVAGYVIVPLFAVANVGVYLGGGALSSALSSRVGLGVLVARIVGKPLGILLVVWWVCVLGVGSLPKGTNWRQMAGVAAIAGVGITVPLFFVYVSLHETALQNQAKVGIVAATVLSPAIGWLVLAAGPRTRKPGSHAKTRTVDRPLDRGLGRRV